MKKKYLIVFTLITVVIIGIAQDVVIIDIGGGDTEFACQNECIVNFYPDDGFVTVGDSNGGYVNVSPFYGNTTGGSGMTPSGPGSVGCGLFEVCRPVAPEVGNMDV